MSKNPVELPGIPTPGSPYSHGIVSGDTVYVSGQGPIDKASGKIVGKTIEEQTELTLRNVQQVLEAAGSSFDDVVKSTCHLLHIEDFDRFNVVYRKFFKAPFPARTTVQSGLWGGILVEVDVVAVKKR